MYLPHKGKQNVIYVCSTFQGIGRSPGQFAVDTDLFVPSWKISSWDAVGQPPSRCVIRLSWNSSFLCHTVHSEDFRTFLKAGHDLGPLLIVLSHSLCCSNYFQFAVPKPWGEIPSQIVWSLWIFYCIQNWGFLLLFVEKKEKKKSTAENILG